MKKLGLLLIAGMAVGCASQKYGFRPTTSVVSAEAGYPAAQYPVPPESPRGEVYVTSFGTRDVDGADGKQMPLIHARLAVANQSGDTDWTVDPGKQMLVSAGGPPQRPDFMEVDGKHESDTRVPRGQRKVFDLYYRVPGGARDISHVTGFELQWQLEGGGQTFAQRTPFTREPYRDYAEAPRTRVAVGVGVGAPWWAFGYGPGWWGGFGFGYYGPWGYPYPYYGYGYGPYWGVGVGRHYGGYYPRYGGGGYYGGGYRGGGGIRGGGGGGGMHSPVIRGRRP